MGEKREKVVVVCQAGGKGRITMRGYKLSYLFSALLLAGAFVAMFYERSKEEVFRNNFGVWALFIGGLIMGLIGYYEQNKKNTR